MHRRYLAGTALLAVLVFPAALSAQDKGELAYNNHCRTCHNLKPGENRLGPTLHKLIGRKAGAAQGYANYSGAMKGAGVTWDAATLDKFIENPQAVVPNNNMKPFAGIPDAEVRKQIIEYLQKKSKEG